MATTVTPEDLRELVMDHLDEQKVPDVDRERLLEDLCNLIQFEMEVLTERMGERKYEHQADPEEDDGAPSMNDDPGMN
jgi:hypothetical protein